MKELPIVDDEGCLLPMAPILLVALSVYPKDPKSRLELATDLIVRLHGGSKGDLSNLVFLLPIIHQAPATDEILRRAVKAQEGAQFASSALQIMLCASEFHPDLEMNLSIAAWGLGQGPVARTRALSGRTQWRYWGTYTAVAPLRLAIETVCESRSPEPEQLIFEPLQDILDLTESIRLYAEERRILRRRIALRVPSSIPTKRVPLPVSPLAPAFLEALKTYKPTNSKQK